MVLERFFLYSEVFKRIGHKVNKFVILQGVLIVLEMQTDDRCTAADSSTLDLERYWSG